MMFHNMKSNFYKIYLLFLVLTIITAGCNKDSSEIKSVEKIKKVSTVKIKEIAGSLFIKRLNLIGRLKASTEVTVSSEEGGIIKEIHFDKGTKVKKGASLVILDDTTLLANLSEVNAAYGLENMNYERLKALKDNAGAVSDFDLKSAEFKKNMAAARVNIIKTRLNKTIIKAPLSGTVYQKFVENGEFLNPGSPVAIIIQTDVIKAEATLTESEIAYFRKGGIAKITVDAYPDMTFESNIDYISPAADNQSSGFLVEIPIHNQKEMLRPGLMVRISLIKEKCEKCIIISQDSIINELTGKFVFLLGKDKKVIKREVYPGNTDKDNVVIKKGLAVGDLIITTGHRNIVEGELVEVVE